MNEIFITILTKAFQLFLVLDPIGNTGIVATLISGFKKERQLKILYRELLLALLFLIIIFFMGSYLVAALGVSQAAIVLTGGIIFFLFAISLLFPGSSMMTLKNLDEEPFFVPIATPVIVGPSSIATVIVYSHDSFLWVGSFVSVLLAWAFTGVVIILGPILLTKIGKTGMHVMDRMVGMICALIAVKMVLAGLKLFLADL